MYFGSMKVTLFCNIMHGNLIKSR